MTKSKKNNSNRPNFFGMIQNVLIASLNKGQFLVGIAGICLIIFILRIPSVELVPFAREVLSVLADWYIIGWFLTIFTTFGWYIGTKRLRRLHTNEIKRISDEKRKLQQHNTKRRLKSSKSKN